MLWSSALHSPQKRGAPEKCAHLAVVRLSVAKLWFSPPQPHDQTFDRGHFSEVGQRMSTGSQQRQMRVAVSAAVVCLRGANPSSTEIFITTIPLYYTYTSNSNPPIIILHSHSSNQITSFTSSFPFPSFLNCKFPTTTYCPVYIRIEFNVAFWSPLPGYLTQGPATQVL